MKIAISGSTGFIGRTLSQFFSSGGWTITPIVREDFNMGGADLVKKVGGQDIIIHLAGAPLAARWTKKYKEQIVSSRVDTTRQMVDAIRNLGKKPDLFISMSAVGIYRQDKIYKESEGVYADDFIGELCRTWESEALKAMKHTRLVIFRTGLVFSPAGGALKKMLPPFRLGLGGPVGDGKQLVSWVHIDDLVSAFKYVIETKDTTGVYNLVAPEVISNREFSKILGRVLKKPAIFPVPMFMLKTIFGEGAASLMARSQGAYPDRLIYDGFRFEFRDPEDALRDLLG